MGLSWNEPLHHDGYTIIKYVVEYSKTDGSGQTTITIDPPELSKTISGLTNGTAYDFKVRAVYDNSGTEENGPLSNLVTETPYGAIGTPEVTAIPGNGEVALFWTSPDLGGNRFSGYVVKWRIGTGEILGAIAFYNPATLSHTVTGLTNGTAYEFSVEVLTSGDISPAGVATATPFGPIAAPEVFAVPGNGEVALSWIPPDLGGAQCLDYVILWRTGGEQGPVEGDEKILNCTRTSTTVTGLTNGTEYTFSVQVIALGGQSPYGFATATPLGPMGTPVVNAVAGDSEVALSWNLPDLGGRDFVAYIIQWRIEGTTNFIGSQTITDPTTLSTTVTGLTNYTNYEFCKSIYI